MAIDGLEHNGISANANDVLHYVSVAQHRAGRNVSGDWNGDDCRS